MGRPYRSRRICSEPIYRSFRPEEACCKEKNTLTVDEYEVIRLIDLEKLTHEQCAKQMDISRTTVTEIYEAAREKLADSLVNGKPLSISGGHYRLCDGSAIHCCRKDCKKAGRSTVLNQIGQKKGVCEMRIAVTYENGEVFQHFGHTGQFKIYDITEGKVVREQVADTSGNGHGALAGLLSEWKVDVLICGGIGGGAKEALSECGIQFYGGVSGKADEAVRDFLAGNLAYDPDTHCAHHAQEGHGHERCGEDKHGCSGSECRG